jgi:hypothetical protein
VLLLKWQPRRDATSPDYLGRVSLKDEARLTPNIIFEYS